MTTCFARRLFLVLIAIAVTPVAARSEDDFKFPQTPAGRCAQAYFKAAAANDPVQWAEFEKNFRAKSASTRRTIEDRVRIHQDTVKKAGHLKPGKILDESEDSVIILVATDSENEVLELGFEMEPGGLAGIAIRGPMDARDAAKADFPLTDEIRKSTVEAICSQLQKNYVFPEVADKMVEAVQKKYDEGAYKSIAKARPFARRLTEDLRAVCHDKHLRVLAGGTGNRGPSGRPARGADDSVRNFGFAKVEILPGNIGYIKLNAFDPTGPAKEVAAGALAFTAFTNALIFDLRDNGGGSPDMIQFISSYLFKKKTHLNSFYSRPDDSMSETWTLEEIPGRRFDKNLPVYVLTSGGTFSAAEEFTYNLKNLKRATIVGETTGGGAHPVSFVELNKHFGMSVPYARAINPITKTNWEGTGVTPDISVSADKALDAAVADAKKKIAALQAADEDDD